MRIIAMAVMYGALSASAWAEAAESLTGKYTGHIARTNRHVGFTLTVNSVDDGIVKGTATRTEKNCFGDFPVEGKIDGDKLILTSTGKGGRGGDCEVNLELRVDGNRLVGATRSGSEVQLSK